MTDPGDLELEPWEREIHFGPNESIVVAQPPDCPHYEIEVWWNSKTDVECVEFKATEQQLRALHRAIGGLLDP